MSFETSDRTALAMNNLALSLLRRGHHREAAATMNEALRVFQKIFASNTIMAQSQPPISHENSESYRRACQRFVETLKKQQEMEERNPLEVNDLDEEDFVAIRGAAVYGPSYSLMFPLRITSSGEQDQRGQLRHFGIILYNHGLTYLVCSQETTNRKRAKKFLAEASKTLNMAQRTFVRLIENFGGIVGDVQAIMMLSLVMNALSQVLDLQKNDANDFHEASAALVKLTFHECFDAQFSKPQNAAAA